MGELARVRVIVNGVVQGVGFRYFVVHVAREYGLTGYVRNREDGSVEVEAEGEGGVLEAFMKDLRTGPRSAHVTGLDIEKLPPGKRCEGFDVHF